MKTIYLDSTQIHSHTGNLGLFVYPNIQGLEMPEIRLSSYSRPNADGGVVSNQLYGGRLVSLQGKVHARTLTDYRQLRRTLESAVRVMRDEEENTKPIILKFTTMDDLELQVEVYTRNFTLPDKWLLHSDFKIDFYSPDFFIQGQELKGETLFVFQGGGMAIPMGIPLDMSANSSIAYTLTNAGNVETFPIIRLNGPLEDPVITNETTGKSFSINHTLASGECIVVDGKNRTVQFYAFEGDSPTNVRAELSGEFITLAPGQNSIKLTDADSDPTAFVTVVWRDSYSGL